MKLSLIFTIPETLVYLEKATGINWPQSYFFQAAIESKLILYAATPTGLFPTLRKLDYGEAVAKEYPEFTRRLAELHNVHITELVSHGDTFTQYCVNDNNVDETIDDVFINVAEVLSKELNPYPDPFEYFFFSEPVHVTVDQVRVPALVIERLIRRNSMDGDVINQPTTSDILPEMSLLTVGCIDTLTAKHPTEKTDTPENKILGPCKLEIGPNRREDILKYIKYRASEIIAADNKTTMRNIGDIVAKELKEKGCKGERGFLLAGTIIRLLPSGVTGGRSRNGRKNSKK